MPSSRAAPEKLRVLATLANTVMLVSRSTVTTSRGNDPPQFELTSNWIIRIPNKWFKTPHDCGVPIMRLPIGDVCTV
jgi:hypothetical protein